MMSVVLEELAEEVEEVIWKSIQDRYSNPKVGLVEAYSEAIVGFAPVKGPQEHDLFSIVDYNAMRGLVVALLEDNKEEVEQELEFRKSAFAKKVVIALQTRQFEVTEEGEIFVGGFEVPLEVVDLVVEREKLPEFVRERLRIVIDESQE